MGATFKAYLLHWNHFSEHVQKQPSRKKKTLLALFSSLTDPETGEIRSSILREIPQWPEGDLLVPAAEIWEAIRGAPEVPAEVDGAAQQILNQTVTLRDYFNDMPGSENSFIVCVSPESAKRLGSLAQKIDLRLYKKSYDERAEDLDKQWIAEQWGGKATPANSFKTCFVPYVSAWLSGIQAAASHKMGFAVAQFD